MARSKAFTLSLERLMKALVPARLRCFFTGTEKHLLDGVLAAISACKGENCGLIRKF